MPAPLQVFETARNHRGAPLVDRISMQSQRCMLGSAISVRSMGMERQQQRLPAVTCLPRRFFVLIISRRGILYPELIS